MEHAGVGDCLGTVHVGEATAEVWFACVTPDAGPGVDCLSDEERAKSERYRSADAAQRYVMTRSLVRSVLGTHLRMPPRRVPLSRTDAGKPIVAAGLHFNVSHSGELILLALCEQRDVGIDVERKRDVPKVEQLSARWLTAAETQQFESLKGAGIGSSDAFLRVWSLKEAKLKALGVGISGAATADLDHVVVRPLDDLLETLTIGDGDSHYVGAVAFA